MGKIIIGLAVLICCTLVGNSYATNHKKRVEYFSELNKYNANLKRNLRFKRENVISSMKDFTQCKDFFTTLESVKMYVTGVSKDEPFIPDYVEDKDFVKEYFLSIGKNCALSELDFLNEYETLINEKLIKIKDNCSKFSKLGQKLGFCVGLVVMIILL